MKTSAPLWARIIVGLLGLAFVISMLPVGNSLEFAIKL